MKASAVSAALLVAAAVAACGGDAESAAARRDTIQTAAQRPAAAPLRAETLTVALPLSLPGQLYAEHDTWLYARTAGVVESLLVDLGSEVRPGDLLARLESADQAIALQQAEVALETSRREADRMRALASTHMISPADSEKAELDLRRADLGRAQARRNLELTRVTAPFAGVVAARSAVRAGRLVAPGDSLFRVTALAPLRTAVHVPEAAAGGIAVGATGWVQGLTGGGARATVIRAAPGVDAASGTREFVLELAGAGLRPGASVTVRLGGERRRVVAVPAAAIADSGYVLVVQDGRTTLRAVTLGATLPDGRVEVVSGVAPGERLAPARP